MQDSARELIDCLSNKRRNQTDDNRQYSECVRKFSLQLHVINPKAYNFVRDQFDKALPHEGTLRKWYSNSDCNGRPGLIIEAYKTLKSMAEIKKTEGKTLLLSLTFDEMSIRKHLQWIHERKFFSGYITYGKQIENGGELPIANNALVFMATCLDTGTSIPIAYQFVTTLDAEEKKILILQLLKDLTEIDCTVVNITFDGLKANISLCELLGASFDVNDPVPYFINPFNKQKVFIFFDPCHMLKLLRNALGDLLLINDPLRGKIQWVFFERLERLRVKNKFVTHRLTKRHIQFYRNKMNVRLACQTLSRSVASSLRYLSSKLNVFKDSESTAFFVETIKNLFDTMNSKKSHKISFRNPIDENNASTIFSFYETVIEYLKTLKFKRVKCIQSRRKTGFIGFIVNMYAVKGMYNEYVRPEKLKSLRLLYHSQDVLESFFSRVRYLGQWNDNPTVQQFQSAIRKLTFFKEINSSQFANCADNLNLLTVSSNAANLRSKEINLSTRATEINYAYVDLRAEKIETEEDVTIAFVTGEIEKKIRNGRFECEICLDVLNDDFKVEGDLVENRLTQRPCLSTFAICKRVHFIFETASKNENFCYDSILKEIWHSIPFNSIFSNSDFSHCPDHKTSFVEYIIDEYVRARATYVAKNKTLELQQKMLRNIKRRTYIFAGQ